MTNITDPALCFNAILGAILGVIGNFLCNKQNNTWMLGNMKNISRVSALEINFIFPHIHVLFSIS